MKLTSVVLLCTMALAGAAPAAVRPRGDARASAKLGEWLEPDFPFFSTILDARRAGIGEHNLTPRGIVIKMPHDCWACFDTDLLRIAAIWRGKGVTDKSLAYGSYHDSGRKTPGGQFPAPQPDGKFWMGNGIFPGWQTGDRVARTDPRDPAPSVGEVGRGPLPAAMGRFEAVRFTGKDVLLEYQIAGTPVSERWTAFETDGRVVIVRHLSVGAATQPLLLVLGAKMNGPSQEIPTGVTLTSPEGRDHAQLLADEDLWLVRVPSHEAPVTFSVAFCDEHDAPHVPPQTMAPAPPVARWPQEATSKIIPSTAPEALVIDHIDLPADNPWKRGVRLSDVQFLRDGTGIGVTIDGDVWILRGLADREGPVRWKRFASGLHEPMSVAIRNDEVFVFDRNGIWRLVDTNGDGEADVHMLFCNAFAQTADMREFPSTVRPGPAGEFYIAKGGQEATTLGKHNGSVLRIAPDGSTAEVLGYGFRQPNLGVNIRTGLVTASDQEGQYIPSTPLHIVRDRQFYGFLSDKRPKEKYPAPIADPLTWMPHAVNASALSQVWLFGAKMGPLNDAMVQVCFNRPDLLRVLMNSRGSRPQAAVVSITNAFDFPPLNGSINPVDGQLYLAGFQVIGWGNTLNTLAGLGRVRYTGRPVLQPSEVVPMTEGVLLHFDTPVDPVRAADPANYSLATWHYKRAPTYGSAQYKEDGSTGIDWLVPSSVYVSKDHRGVFIGVPGMKPAMQLRVGWSILSADAARMEGNAYTTPYELVRFDPAAEGFADTKVNLTPRSAAAERATPVTVEEGRRLSEVLGCVACHSVKDQDLHHVGPRWKGLFGSERKYIDSDRKPGAAVADEAYLRESILQPAAKKVAGFERGEYAMPSYAGAVTDAQVDALILYIKSLSR